MSNVPWHRHQQRNHIAQVGPANRKAEASRETRGECGITDRNNCARGNSRRDALGGPVNEEIDKQRRQEQHRRISDAFEQQQAQA